MRITVVFEDTRLPLDVRPDDKVQTVKNMVNKKLLVDTMDDKRVGSYLELRFAGAALQNDWVLQDLSVISGSVIKSALKTVQKPKLQVYLNYNGETLSLTEDIDPLMTQVGELRSVLSRRLGIPVSVFRLSRIDKPDSKQLRLAGSASRIATKTNQRKTTELYDSNTLDYYGIEIGATVRLDVWDGWRELILSAVAGHEKLLQRYLSWDRDVRSFQYRVLLYIAAHYGHMGLSTSMMRHGAKPHEPVGTYPSRKWCMESEHKETIKCPVHVACIRGHLPILRLFVRSSPLCFVALDEQGRTPMQITLRYRHRDCFEFLIVRQWGRKMTNDFSVSIIVYCRMLQWSERAKATALLKYGTDKSTYKGKPPKAGALVGAGVLIDGFSKVPANSLAFDEMPKPALSPDRVLPAIAMAKRKLRSFRQQRQTSVARRISTSSATSSRNRLNSARTAASIRSTISRTNSMASGLVPLQNEFSHEREMLRSGNQRQATRRRNSVLKNGNSSGTKYSSSNESILPGESQLKLTSSKDVDKESVIGDLRGISKSTSNGLQRKDSRISFNPDSFINARTPTTNDDPQASFTYTPYSSLRSLQPAVKRKKALPAIKPKVAESAIPLPQKSLECQLKPFFYWSPFETLENPVDETLRRFESYRGTEARQHAVQCLAVTSEFTEKRWLQQLQLAVSLTRRGVKKRRGPGASPVPTLV